VKETVESISANEVTSIAMDLIGQVEPIDMTAELQKFLVEAAEWRGDKPLSMPSGAGHDAMIMAQRLPSAMLFVPSIGGRSHDISEDTKIEDIVFGCQVMADSIAKLCGGQANAGRS